MRNRNRAAKLTGFTDPARQASSASAIKKSINEVTAAAEALPIPLLRQKARRRRKAKQRDGNVGRYHHYYYWVGHFI